MGKSLLHRVRHMQGGTTALCVLLFASTQGFPFPLSSKCRALKASAEGKGGVGSAVDSQTPPTDLKVRLDGVKMLHTLTLAGFLAEAATVALSTHSRPRSRVLSAFGVLLVACSVRRE